MVIITINNSANPWKGNRTEDSNRPESVDSSPPHPLPHLHPFTASCDCSNHYRLYIQKNSFLIFILHRLWAPQRHSHVSSLSCNEKQEKVGSWRISDIQNNGDCSRVINLRLPTEESTFRGRNSWLVDCPWSVSINLFHNRAQKVFIWNDRWTDCRLLYTYWSNRICCVLCGKQLFKKGRYRSQTCCRDAHFCRQQEQMCGQQQSSYTPNSTAARRNWRRRLHSSCRLDSQCSSDREEEEDGKLHLSSLH